MLTQEQRQYLRILQDPVAWAKHEFGWDARPYQEEPLRDKSRNIVLRWGRRAGKSDVLAIRAIYAAFTREDDEGDQNDRYTVLIIAPQEDHIRELFNRIRDLIYNSENVSASIEEDRREPQEIVFYNKSVIRGVTAGTKSSRKALGARGKRANLLIYDEADYLDDEDIANSLVIIAEKKNVRVIAASTPTGRRSFFWRWCTDKSLGWKEYHVPTTKSPNWTPELERQLRAELPALKFEQEVMANFGEQEEGVFPKRFIDSALARGIEARLTYYDEKNPPPKRKDCPRILGVDWDKYGAATNMIGLEFRREWGIYVPIVRVEVPKHIFTLSHAVQRIIELDRRFKFDYILVDRGYGEYQVEELHRYGMTHPETKLAERVIGISFGDSIEVPDPFTRKKRKQPLKPFMINNLSVAFEQERFALVPDDDQLRRQLEEYRVISTSSDGIPRFSEENDHLVSALALAYHGFILKFSDLLTVPVEFHVAPIRSFGSESVAPSSRDLVRQEPAQVLSTGIIVPLGRQRRRSYGRDIFGSVSWPSRSIF